MHGRVVVRSGHRMCRRVLLPVLGPRLAGRLILARPAEPRECAWHHACQPRAVARMVFEGGDRCGLYWARTTSS